MREFAKIEKWLQEKGFYEKYGIALWGKDNEKNLVVDTNSEEVISIYTKGKGGKSSEIEAGEKLFDNHEEAIKFIENNYNI